MFRATLVQVAILDDGIDEDVVGRNAISLDLVERNAKAAWRKRRSKSGTYLHGTLCALTLLSICEDVQLYSVRVMISSKEGYLPDIVRGLEWVAKRSFDIVLIPLGTASPVEGDELRNACRIARKSGAVLIGAGHPGHASLPAIYDDVIGVAPARSMPTDRTSSGMDGVSVYCSGAWIGQQDIAGIVREREYSSLSAARFAGIVANMRLRDPGLTSGAIYQMHQEEGEHYVY